MDTRRDFLKKVALLSGSTGLASMLPPSIMKALAIDPVLGSTWKDAEHIVILMQENRSFDHCFGTLRGVRGFNDPRAIDLPNKNKVWCQSNDQGETYAPFHLDIKETKSTWMESLPHSWSNQTNARNDGKFDQWLNVKRNSNEAYAHIPQTMGYHTRDDLPFYYALADAFTVCDQNFCSGLTGTNANRLFFWTGTVRPEPSELSRAHVYNQDMDYGSLHWSTFPEKLEEKGISWKCYQNEVSIDVGFKGEQDVWLSNFQDNPLEFFSQYHIHHHKTHEQFRDRELSALPDAINSLQASLQALAPSDPEVGRIKKEIRVKKQALESLTKENNLMGPASFESLSAKEKNIHAKAFVSNTGDPDYHQLTELSYPDHDHERRLKIPKGDVLHQFRRDVAAGALPTVSWLTAPENFSDHPSAPWYGAWYISEVMDILTEYPEVWKKTIFILAYDENDGYFDHVPPFTAPNLQDPNTGRVSSGMNTAVDFVTREQALARNGFPEKFERESSIGLGFRVPLLIASPWTRGGWVNSEIFDHTSTLQFLEKFLTAKTGHPIVETNISDWRRTICGDLTSAFRPYQGEKMNLPEFVDRDRFLQSIHQAKFKRIPTNYHLLSTNDIEQINRDPGASPYMPRQEKGIKPACGLCYQLYAEGHLASDKKSFTVKFEAGKDAFGNRSLGAPFNVYAPGKYRIERDKQEIMEEVHTWAYAVKAGDQVVDSWPLDAFLNQCYHLQVYGPNGFYREYKGSANDPALELRCQFEQAHVGTVQSLTGNIMLHVLNAGGGKDLQIQIIDNAYNKPMTTIYIADGQDAVKPVFIDLKPSHGWYDFSVSLPRFPDYQARYAGRVETGESGYTDPLMAS